MLVTALLAASLVSGQTVVDLLIGDSSIGESDIQVVGGVLEGTIIASDSTATTYDVSCALTSSVAFPFSTPACVGGAHVTITQGPSTMFLSQVYVTTSTSQNFRQNCTYSNSETITCSIINTVSETLVIGGVTTTTSYTETSSGVNASPSNGPLYFQVTLTAGAEAATTTTGSTSATLSSASGSTVESRTSSGAKQAIVKGKWVLLSALSLVVYSIL